jgi:hypothetical protein
VPGPLVDEIDVQPLDFGDDLIKSVERGLTSAPKPTTRHLLIRKPTPSNRSVDSAAAYVGLAANARYERIFTLAAQ